MESLRTASLVRMASEAEPPECALHIDVIDAFGLPRVGRQVQLRERVELDRSAGEDSPRAVVHGRGDLEGVGERADAGARYDGVLSGDRV